QTPRNKYYRYCTYIYIPFQYASVILGERSDGKRSWASEATGRDSVARVTRPRDFGPRVGVPPARRAGGERQGSRSAQRIPYAEASRVLLRDSILDGMRELLLSRDWSSI